MKLTLTKTGVSPRPKSAPLQIKKKCDLSIILIKWKKSDFNQQQKIDPHPQKPLQRMSSFKYYSS